MRNHSQKELEDICKVVLDHTFDRLQKSLDNSHYDWPQSIYDRLDAVSFSVSSNKRVKAYGRCWYFKGHLEIYPHNFKHEKIIDFKDTIIHEYAHYATWLLYGASGHCKEWKQLCKVLGCDHMASHKK